MSNEPIPKCSTWIRFRATPSPPHDGQSLDTSIFQPLIAWRDDYRNAFYGRVAETPDQYVLMVAWTSTTACDAFTVSAEGGRQLVANLTAAGSDGCGDGQGVSQKQSFTVAIRKADFGRIPFWCHFGPNTEVRTAYFPPARTGEEKQHDELREAVMKIKTLVLGMTFGIDGSMTHLCPYRGVPACGWVVEELTGDQLQKEIMEDNGSRATSGLPMWEGQQASACMWTHYWKNKEAEQSYKTTERRLPENGKPLSQRLLATEAFDRDLKRFGALGWEDYHVDFEKLPKDL